MAGAGTDGPNKRYRITVLLSGSGRTLRNLLECIGRGALDVEPVRVISTRKRVAGNEIAREAGIPLSIVPRRSFDDDEAFSESVIDVLEGENPDLVVCAGFLSKLVVPERYLGRILNIHPSLLPLFGGKGYYGERVHQAVLESGMKVSGCTVHFVDNAYDAGPIIAQRCEPVLPEDTPGTLGTRIFQVECRLYPVVIREVLDGRIRLAGGEVLIDEGASIAVRNA